MAVTSFNSLPKALIGLIGTFLPVNEQPQFIQTSKRVRAGVVERNLVDLFGNGGKQEFLALLNSENEGLYQPDARLSEFANAVQSATRIIRKKITYLNEKHPFFQTKSKPLNTTIREINSYVRGLSFSELRELTPLVIAAYKVNLVAYFLSFTELSPADADFRSRLLDKSLEDQVSEIKKWLKTSPSSWCSDIELHARDEFDFPSHMSLDLVQKAVISAENGVPLFIPHEAVLLFFHPDVERNLLMLSAIQGHEDLFMKALQGYLSFWHEEDSAEILNWGIQSGFQQFFRESFQNTLLRDETPLSTLKIFREGVIKYINSLYCADDFNAFIFEKSWKTFEFILQELKLIKPEYREEILNPIQLALREQGQKALDSMQRTNRANERVQGGFLYSLEEIEQVKKLAYFMF